MIWTLVTGGTGDIGAELVRELLRKATPVRILSRDQSRQMELKALLERDGFPPELYRFFIGDVRDIGRLKRAFRDVHTIYHLAALKHVDSCEYNPEEAIKTNVGGTSNVIDAAIASGVQRVIYSSSDKAAEPNNIMGATKLTAEKLITQANSHHPEISFACVRFGNVLGSRGSVLPVWREQLRSRGAISITDPVMTRYVLTLKRSVELLLQAARCVGGEVLLRKMPVVKLETLAKVFTAAWRRTHDVDRVGSHVTGPRPGETTHEKIITCEESTRTHSWGDYYVILPTMLFGSRDYSRYREPVPVRMYDSSQREPLSLDALRDLLLVNNLI